VGKESDITKDALKML